MLLYCARGAKQAWLNVVKESFDNIAGSSAKLEECVDYSVTRWASSFKNQPTIWKSVAAARDDPLWNALIATDAPEPITLADRMVYCGECGQAFVNTAALKSHAATYHGYANPFRMRCDTEACPVCLLHFQSVVRTLRHFNTSPICAFNAMKLAPAVDLSDSGGIGFGQLGHYAKSAGGPLCTRAEGPLLPMFGLDMLPWPYEHGQPLAPATQRHVVLRTLERDIAVAVQDAIDDGWCAAAFYRPCSGECLLCGGVDRP